MSTSLRSALQLWWRIAVAGLLVLGLVGCGGKQEQYGDKKSDWVRTKPPPYWRGPGQPAGPPPGALSGPASTPPASATGAPGR